MIMLLAQLGVETKVKTLYLKKYNNNNDSPNTYVIPSENEPAIKTHIVHVKTLIKENL